MYFRCYHQGVFTDILTNNDTVDSDANRTKFSIAVQFYIGCISLHYYKTHGINFNLGKIFNTNRKPKAALHKVIEWAIKTHNGDMIEKNKIVALSYNYHIKYDGQNILLYQVEHHTPRLTNNISNQEYSILSQIENIPMNGEQLHYIKTKPNSLLPLTVGFLRKTTNGQILFVPFLEGLERLQPPTPPTATKPNVLQRHNKH
ncbi:MAG: hypothetical protein ACI9CD_000931 [Candidatus Deianiraeaceae bacterium]